MVHTLASRTDILETNETDETTHEDEKGDGTLYIEAARNEERMGRRKEVGDDEDM